MQHSHAAAGHIIFDGPMCDLVSRIAAERNACIGPDTMGWHMGLRGFYQ